MNNDFIEPELSKRTALKIVIFSMNLKYSKVAQDIGISNAYLTLILSGGRPLHQPMIDKFITAYHLPKNILSDPLVKRIYQKMRELKSQIR